MSIRHFTSSTRVLRRRRRGPAYVGTAKSIRNEKAKREIIYTKSEMRRITLALKRKAKSLGFFSPRITTVETLERFHMYEKWIEKGMHGDMKWLEKEDRVERRRDFSKVLPGVKAVISVSLPYWPGINGFPIEQSCSSRDVDTGAVLEREIAERAGVGFVGKNTMLIQDRVDFGRTEEGDTIHIQRGRRGYGSGVFLAEIFTTLELEADESRERSKKEKRRSATVEKQEPRRAGCGSCTKCLVNCPTNALSPSREYILDARECISYLTIEKSGGIPLHLRSKMGNMVYGCDICNQVCPWNQFDWKEEKKSPLFGKVSLERAAPSLLSLIEENGILRSDENFNSFFENSPILRTGRKRMLRNSCVAAGNYKVNDKSKLDISLQLVKALQNVKKVEEDDTVITEHAEWALKRLKENRLKING
eukprot:g3634.t1